MRFDLRRLFLTALMAAIVVSCAVTVMAQDAPTPPQDTPDATTQAGETPPAPEDMAEEETVRRHPGLFGIAVGVQSLVPIHILKEEISDMNDLTASGLGFNGGVRLYILDSLALTVDYRRSGMGFADNKVDEMALIRGLLDNGDIFNADTYLKLDGFAFGVTSYLGSRMSPDSNFNPFITANALIYDWAVTAGDRDGAALSYQGEAIEGTDVGMSIGFGTEYGVSEKALIEVGMAWHYLLTGDEILYAGFQAPNKSFYWTNTHWWGFTANLVFGF